MSVFIVIGLFFLGMLLGRLLRSFRFVGFSSSKLMMWAVYLLLFILGVSVGSNPEIVEKIPNLGVQSAVLAIGAIIGSLLVVNLFMYIHARKKR